MRRVGKWAVRNQPLAFILLAPGLLLPPCCATVPLKAGGIQSAALKTCYEANESTVLVTSDKGGNSPETGLGRPGMHVLLGVTAETAAAGRSLR